MTKSIPDALTEALARVDAMVEADPSLAPHADAAKQGLREAAELAANG